MPNLAIRNKALGNPANATPALDAAPLYSSVAQAQRAALSLPFDMARFHYAQAVQAGWMKRSMLASAQFGKAVAAMEQLALGPWARQV